MKALTVGLKAAQSDSTSPAPRKHQRRIPPLEKMAKKSNMLLREIRI